MLKNAEEWRWCIHYNHNVQEEKIKHNVKRKGNLYEKIIEDGSCSCLRNNDVSRMWQ